MCLFLQNQDFQKHTEAVLNILSTGARQAAEQLTSMNSGLGSQLMSLEHMVNSMEGLEQAQQRVITGVEKELSALERLQSQAVNMDDKLAVVIRNEVRHGFSLHNKAVLFQVVVLAVASRLQLDRWCLQKCKIARIFRFSRVMW